MYYAQTTLVLIHGFFVLNVDQGKNNKRPNEAGPQTPVSAKKAKNATPGKTGDGKKGVHIATPHPMKKAGKTPQNVAKNQSPSSNKYDFFIFK